MSRNSAIEKLIPDYSQLAKTHTAIEIAEMYGMHADTVRRFLFRNGVDAVRYCKRCDKNRPPEDFEKPTHRSCTRHERDESGRSPDRGIQAVWENALWQGVKDDQALVSCWMATPEGQPNGPLERWA